jgi:hypothetical protein
MVVFSSVSRKSRGFELVHQFLLQSISLAFAYARTLVMNVSSDLKGDTIMKTQEATTVKKATKTKATNAAIKPATKEAGKTTKAPKAKAKKAKPETKATRAGNKTAIILDLLRRKEGATLAEIAKATGWQNHSIRRFISGQVTKKMGLKVESEKVEGERRYRLPA